MTYRAKTNSILLTILMVLSTTLILPSDEVEAAEVVITDAVRVVDGGPMNERMVSMAADSEETYTLFGAEIHNISTTPC